jgi:hypothetical protein
MSEINVSRSVGRGGVNSRNDVLVVQALMKYALPGRPGFHISDFSQPDGYMGPRTIRLIEKYQRFLRKNCKERISVDGRIDPGKGAIASGRKLKYTIRMLNRHALDAYAMEFFKEGDGGNFIADLVRKFPEIRMAIPNLPAGSLQLALE